MSETSEAQEILKRLTGQRISMRTIASALNVSVSYLSAVHNGLKPASEKVLSQLQEYEAGVHPEPQAQPGTNSGPASFLPGFPVSTSIVPGLDEQVQQLQALGRFFAVALKRQQEQARTLQWAMRYLNPTNNPYGAMLLSFYPPEKIIQQAIDKACADYASNERAMSLPVSPSQQALPSGPKLPALPQKAATLNRARVRDMRGRQPTRVLMCAICHCQIKASDWMIAIAGGKEFDIHERCQDSL